MTSEDGAPQFTRLQLKFIHEEAISLTVERDISIADLKRKIFETTNTPIELQRLIYKGKVLRDHMLLAAYNFVDGDTIHVVASPRPPAPAQAAPAQAAPAPVAAPAETPVQNNQVGENDVQMNVSMTLDTSPLRALLESAVGMPNVVQVQRPLMRSPPVIALTFGSPPPPPQPPRPRRDPTTSQNLLDQAIHLRQAATRLSHLPMISLHPQQGRLATTLNEFSHSLLILSRQVASLSWSLTRLQNQDDLADPNVQRAITETIQLLRELGSFCTPLQEALSDLIVPPPQPQTVPVINIIRVPVSEERQQNQPSTGNIILSLLQAVGNAVRGARDVANSLPQTPENTNQTAPPDPPVVNMTSEEVHIEPLFSDSSTPLLATHNPLDPLLDVVYRRMQEFFVLPQALHEMPNEFVASLHRLLQNKLQTALGFTNEVAPSQLPQEIKKWSDSAARQFEEWLVRIWYRRPNLTFMQANILADCNIRWREDSSDGVYARLFKRFAELILQPCDSTGHFATEMQLIGRRFVSALFYIMLNLHETESNTSSIQGLAEKVLVEIVNKTTEQAHNNHAIDDVGVRTIRHVMQSIFRDQIDRLLTRTFSVTH